MRKVTRKGSCSQELILTLNTPRRLAILSKAPYIVSNRVKTWTGSLVLLHDVNPAISANKMVVSGKTSAMGGEELGFLSSDSPAAGC